jgi:hypothetical protein
MSKGIKNGGKSGVNVFSWKKRTRKILILANWILFTGEIVGIK